MLVLLLILFNMDTFSFQALRPFISYHTFGVVALKTFDEVFVPFTLETSHLALVYSWKYTEIAFYKFCYLSIVNSYDFCVLATNLVNDLLQAIFH